MLNNGISMPILGLGVWKTKSGKECKEAVLNALEAGYRHIDTARIY
ncbi:oxidoreductase, aldo/keto reductase domain protein, partial [Leptospira interrogans str. 2002000626]